MKAPLTQILTKAIALRALAFISFLTILNSACSDKAAEQNSGIPHTSIESISNTLADQRLPGYEINDQLWSNSLAQIKAMHPHLAKLKHNVDKLLNDPSSNEQSLVAGQQAWQNLAIDMQQLSFPFSVIHYLANYSAEAEKLSVILNRVTTKPIAPGFIDSFESYTHSGIVNDISLPLNSKNLLNQHRVTAQEEVLLGLYAIEYLLFSEFINRKPSRKQDDFTFQKTLSPEKRELGYRTVQELSENRRRELLKLQIEQLHIDLLALETGLSELVSLNSSYWGKLSDTQIVFIVKKLSTQSVTQLLTAMAEFNHPDLAPYEGVTTPAERNLSTIQHANWVTHYLRGLKNATGYLKKSQRDEWLNTITHGINELQNIEDSALETNQATNKTVWQNLNQQLKRLVSKENLPMEIQSSQSEKENA